MRRNGQYEVIVFILNVIYGIFGSFVAYFRPFTTYDIFCEKFEIYYNQVITSCRIKKNL